MLSSPPSRPTTLTPNEIIGVEMAEDFLNHFRITSSESNDGGHPVGRLKKEVGLDKCFRIGGIYRDLRENGFYPLGLTNFGQIRWGIALQTPTATRIEKELTDNPITNIEDEKAKARNGYKNITSPVEIPLSIAA